MRNIKRISALLLAISSIITVSACDIKKDDAKNDEIIIDTNDNNTEENNGNKDKQTYIVTFYTNGGTSITQVSVLEGNKITRPTDPTKTSDDNYKYDFVGWFTDEALTDSFNFNTPINGNLTLYAKWNISSKITVSFESNGGSSIDNINIFPGDKISKPADPTKADDSNSKYEFAGWFTDSALNTPFDFSKPINDNLTLYAKWDVTNKITVSFNTNGGTPIDDIKIFPGDKINKPSNPTKASDSNGSYEFAGWFTDDTYSKEFNFNEAISESTTIFAKWNVTNKITVSFNTNGGTLIDDIKILPGEKITKPADPTKASDSNAKYEFAGWFSDSTLNTPFNFNEAINDSTTIFAKWNVTNNITISFNTNGGTSLSDITIFPGEKINAPTNPTKATDSNAKYEFAGWYSDSTLNTPFNFNEAINEATTIFAKWNVTNKITVTFDSNGGSTVNQVKVFPGEKITEPAEPTKAADSNYVYNFLGWYTDNTFSTEFNFNDAVNDNITLIAKWGQTAISADTIILSSKGYNEGIYVNFKVASQTNANNSKVSYSTNGIDYTEIDKELVRYDATSNTVRADILGLKAGSYLVKVYNGASTEISSTINVSSDDRSGYAHNDGNSVGAYNNDGSLKTDTVVVYVSEETKNTVTATIANKTYTGLANILQAQSKSSVPLNIRILGTIGAPTWNKIEYATSGSTGTYTVGNTTVTKNGEKDYNISIKNSDGTTLTSGNTQDNLISSGYNTLDNSYPKLNGLTSKINGSEGDYDSYWNMLDISNAKNVTVEGIGADATITQWGFTWKNCSYIEVKNLTFNDYPEDACSFEASDTGATSLSGFKTGYIWIHNNTFNQGKNNWDVCKEQDKHEGDGATDFKGMKNITVSYNHYYKNHKTGLLGGDGKHHQANVTFHHNWYEQNQSRLPYGRQANMHMYNNFYDSSTGTNMQIHDGGYAFIENCYFKDTKKTFEVITKKTTQVPAIKSYQNIYDNCKVYDITNVTITNDRTLVVSNDCLFGSSFDTDSTLFYYDSVNKKSNVTIMNDASELPTLLPLITGAGTLPNFNLGEYKNIDSNPTIETYTVTFNTNGGTAISDQTVTSGSTISSVSTTKANYTFKGWYTDQALTKSFNVTTPITSNLTLYAKWEENSSSGDNQDSKIIYTMNDFTKGTITENTTVGDLTITIKSGKSTEIANTSGTVTIENTAITKYAKFGGAGSYSELSIQFSLSKTSNITVYYAATSGRYIALYSEDGNKIVAKTATTGTGANNLVSYTFTNVSAGNYAATSNASGIEVYAIVIE